MAKRYEVTLHRTREEWARLVVEAANKNDAKEAALMVMNEPDTEWTDGDAGGDETVENVVELDKENTNA